MKELIESSKGERTIYNGARSSAPTAQQQGGKKVTEGKIPETAAAWGKSLLE